MLRHCLKFTRLSTRKIYKPTSGVRLLHASRPRRKQAGDDQKECPKDGSGRGFYYTLGTVIVGTGAVVAYAKHDPEFRCWLQEQAPWTDGFIAFLTAEELSHGEFLMKYFGELKEDIINDVSDLLSSKKPDTTLAPSAGKPAALPPCDEEMKPYKPPTSAFKPLTEKKPEPEKYTETRISVKKDADEDIAKIGGEVKKSDEDVKDDMSKVHPMNLLELEGAIGDSAREAIKGYQAAICVLRDHAEEIYKVVEESVESVSPNIWAKVKKKAEERGKLLKRAEDAAKKAEENIFVMKANFDDPAFPGGEEVKAQAKRNIERIVEAVAEAKSSYEDEKEKASVTDKYWNKVQEARKHFSEEFEMLFPNVRISDKNLRLSAGDVDLFVLYAFQNILFFQKELSKLDTIGELKLKKALERAELGEDETIEALVENELEKERRKLRQEFQQRMLSWRSECESDMRQQMKRQAEAHSDHLQEAMLLKEREVERKMQRKIDERIIEEKKKFKMEIAGIVGRLKGLDEAMRKRAGQDKKAQKSQVLWSACQALEAALRTARYDIPWLQQLRPLQNEVTAISKAAAPGDDLVKVVVDTIPEEALVRGVFSEAALKDRFSNVERVAKRVAILPEGGASLPVMFLSYLHSLVIFTPSNPIPPYELANEPFEPAQLTTHDILHRARFWMDRGDYQMALKYMNLLEGAAKAIASDWMKELKVYLETMQAAQALLTHASAAGLAYS